MITKVLEHENEIGHLVMRYSATSQCLFSDSDLTLIILIQYSPQLFRGSLHPHQMFCIHCIIPPLPASPPATTMRPPTALLVSFSPLQPLPHPPHVIHKAHTRSYRDCDTVINTSFTLDLRCQRERGGIER